MSNMTLGQFREMTKDLPDDAALILKGQSGMRYLLPEYAITVTKDAEPDDQMVEWYGEVEYFNPEQEYEEEAVILKNFVTVESEA